MQQLTIGDLKAYIEELECKGYDLNNIPVYLGNDDELNGVHNGWCVELIDKNDNNEDMQYIVDMIEQDYATSDLKDKGILIS